LEFSCWDGTCLDLSVRCNGIDDCFDSSDEIDCQVVLISKSSYKNENPPFLSGQITQINVSSYIDYIGSFDRSAMTFRAGFDIDLSWFDKRLKYVNLKHIKSGMKIGREEMNSIWVPRLIFTNSLDGERTLFHL